MFDCITILHIYIMFNIKVIKTKVQVSQHGRPTKTYLKTFRRLEHEQAIQIYFGLAKLDPKQSNTLSQF